MSDLNLSNQGPRQCLPSPLTQKYLRELEEIKSAPLKLLTDEAYKFQDVIFGDEELSDVEMSDVEPNSDWEGECEVHLRERLLAMKRSQICLLKYHEQMYLRLYSAATAIVVHQERQSKFTNSATTSDSTTNKQ